MLRLLGIALWILLVPAVLMFRVGWAKRRPGQPWPLKIWLAVSGILVMGYGLLGAQWLVVALGAALYAAQFLAPLAPPR